MMKKLKLTTIIFAICCVSFLAFLAFNPSHAYFQIFTDPVGINTAKVDLLFDKFTPNQEVEGDDTTTGKYTYGSFSGNIYTDAWGTIKNPYVMTGKNHVNNLFILQKSGYFEKKVDENNETRQSYFVVSNKDGTPIVIDCNGMNINPIGTPAKPFTGNIQGAPLTGTAEYKTETTTYQTSQSTIANLNVIASENTPDIGFFGYLGFEGDLTITTTKTPDGLDKDGNAVYKYVESATMDGFAASVSNLLFADVTIKTKQTVGTNWWADAGKRTVTRITVDENGNASTPVTAEENIDSAHGDCAETHHIGIVAGHAEWAKLEKISVYFSEDVAAFDLPEADNSDTSFYSISGILGTIKFVNPTVTDTGVMSSEGSVSDETLELTGGGGNASGTLTGYMLAKNIFDAHDANIAGANKQEKYNTALMVDKNGNPIFTKVTMPEGETNNLRYRNYYFFKDSIFTFAMSASHAADSAGNSTGNLNDAPQKDYVLRIWPIDETAEWDQKTPPPITIAAPGAGSTTSWEYKPDPSSINYIHKLKRVYDVDDLDSGGSYVLTYMDGAEGAADTTIYVFHLKTYNQGFVEILKPWEGNIFQHGTTTLDPEYKTITMSSDNNNVVDTLYVDSGSVGTSCYYAFQYDALSDNNGAGYTFSDGQYSLGITSTADEGFGGSTGAAFPTPSIVYDIGDNQNKTVFRWHEWNILENDEDDALPATFKVTLRATAQSGQTSGAGAIASVAAGFYSKLVFDITSNNSTTPKFNVVTNVKNGWLLNGWNTNVTEPKYSEDENGQPNGELTANQKQGFAIFKVESVEISAESPLKYIPTTGAITHNFNPSTDVLFYDHTATTGENYYSVEPLKSKKWNSGNGTLLESLNHAVQLTQATPQSTKISMADHWLGQLPYIGGLFSWLWDNNSGGVIHTPIGTNGKGYSIPLGTVAFDITKASNEEPSFINVVVAINPGYVTPSSIGLWYMEEGAWNQTFTLTNPDQQFPLPISKEVISQDDGKYVTYISNYTTENTDGTFDPHEGNYTTHLDGKTVLVGYSFRVTTPGIYLMASTSGPMNVAYFSVDGAAGYGDDGTGAMPLGDIDFVYDNGVGGAAGDMILTVDKKYTEEIHELSKETLTTAYYPSYFYLRMYPNMPKPDVLPTEYFGTIPYEKVYVRRYILADYPTTGVTDRKRVIYLSATDTDTHLRGTSSFYQDIPLANYPTT